MTATAKESPLFGSVRYTTLAIVLHWLIAAAIVLQIVLSSRMDGPRTPESFAVTQLHKSIGVTVLLLSLLRLGWRLAHPMAPLPATMARWERRLSRIVHVGFYVIMIGMPLTGWIMVSASRVQLPTLLYGVFPWPNLPLHDLAARQAWHSFGENGHGLLAKAVYVLLAAHVAGALKHQLLSRDEPVLARMAPGAVAGRWLEPRLAIILLALLGVIALGEFLTPPSPRMSAPPVAVTALSPVQEPGVQGPKEPSTHDTSAVPTVGAAPAIPAPTSPAPSGPVKWIVLPGSTLGFTTAWSGQPIQGRFDRWKADIAFSPDALDLSKVSVSIDVGSVNTGDKQRDAALPSGDWFDAAAHPKAIFTASRFEKAGPDRYVAHGTLSLKGMTRPEDVAFRLKIVGDQASVTGSTSLDRSAFAIGQGEFEATDQIPGAVQVQVALKARR